MRVLVVFVAACASSVEPSGRAADVIVDAPAHTGSGFYDSDKAINGVRGGGEATGSTDVYSLGDDPGIDDFLVLSWSGARVADGPGADFVIFENAFVQADTDRVFIEAAIVEVSVDGVEWIAMPHDYTAPDETMYSPDPAHWSGFAGVAPVLYNVDDNPVDPFSDEAGGDRFDLAVLGDRVQGGVTAIRIWNASTRTNPDTGAPYPHSPIAQGPDIDGVVARYFAAE
jgi:hypothetical protein